MQNTDKKTLIKKCPCCRGNPEWVDLKSESTVLWQISCNHCGMATNFDTDRMICLQTWNQRRDEHKERTGWALLILFSSFLVIIAFIVGLTIGINTT